MPDDTPENKRLRRIAMRQANRELNRYTRVASPYLSALRTVRLAEGYKNIDDILGHYDEARLKLDSERELSLTEERSLNEKRRLDAENKKQQRKIKKR